MNAWRFLCRRGNSLKQAVVRHTTRQCICPSVDGSFVPEDVFLRRVWLELERGTSASTLLIRWRFSAGLAERAADLLMARRLADVRIGAWLELDAKKEGGDKLYVLRCVLRAGLAAAASILERTCLNFLQVQHISHHIIDRQQELRPTSSVRHSSLKEAVEVVRHS